MVERLRAVLGLDDGIRLGEAALEVAALVAPRLGEQRAARDRLGGVEERLELLPLDVDQPDGCLCLPERLGGDRGDGAALEARLVADALELAGSNDAEHARGDGRGGEVDPPNAGVCMRAAQQDGVDQAG